MSLLGINASLKGNCAQAGGAMRIIPSTASAEISLRLVPNQVIPPLYSSDAYDLHDLTISTGRACTVELALF